jgi:hypothetical protein
MRRDEFEIIMISLMMANLAAVYLVGATLFREMQRPPRIVRIYEGGRNERSEGGQDGDAA